MSWSIEEHIGDCRPFPAQVIVYRGETDECLAYVSGEVADRFKGENRKLRELVRISIEYCNSGTCDECPIQGDDGSCQYAEMALKLGVEVQE